MTAKQISEAAKKHAEAQLGPEQYKQNKEAARAIAADFKAGVAWLKKQLSVSSWKPVEDIK